MNGDTHMSWNNKVIWSEGMLLQPHHLQQHDRYLHSILEARTAGLRPYSWGMSHFKIDEALLAQGKLALLACSAVLPDGTTLNLPADDDLPLPLNIPEEARNVVVMLALPTRRPGIAEVVTEREADYTSFARYRSAEYEVGDSNGLDNSALMQVGKLRLRLALEGEVANAYTCLGIARVLERCTDNRVLLDPDYCPPSLDYRAARRLAGFADELLGLLHQRGTALASRLGQPGTAGAAEIADFLLLQLINRAEPLFAHLASMTGLHPEQLYRAMLQLAGELSTFSRPDKRCIDFPVYRHDKLRETFSPVMDELRQSLSMVTDAHAVPLPMEERQFGIRIAIVPDSDLIKTATFVLAVNAQMPAESVRREFPSKVKMGSVDKIRDLVNLQLPGIALRPLPVAPRQLPFHAGFTYFELDKTGEFWQPMLKSGAFALQVPNEFPGLQMQFWAIRK